MILKSYAKLNLYLEVLNKRKDSFHNIKTIFERIDLADKISLKLRPKDKKIKVITNSAIIPTDNRNLAYRAAELLQKSLGVKSGVEIKLTKRIPIGAGLGGGSSNAASLFIGLNKLWKLGLSQKKLICYAKKLGSDVPFFISNYSFAQGSGRGDEITPLKSLKQLRLWHILVVPKIEVSTKFIYQEWDSRYSRGIPNFSQIVIARRAKPDEAISKKEIASCFASLAAKGSVARNDNCSYSPLTPPFLKKDSIILGRAGLTKPISNVNIMLLALKRKDYLLLGESLFNSLEEVSSSLYPQIRHARNKLSRLGVKSILMSGSGPAVFGIVSSRKEAVTLGRKLRRQMRSSQVFVTRTA